MAIWNPPAAGGGGGATLSEATAASLSDGESVNVTHPAVALDSGEIRFSALATLAGESSLASPSTWTDYDLREGSGATWVQDSGADGHFSVAPGIAVPGCRIWLSAGGYASINTMTGDGTAPSSVTLSVAVATGGIEAIWSSYGQGSDLYCYYSGSTYPDFSGAAAPYSISDTLLSQADLADIGTLAGPSGTGPGRGAISLDGGVSWLVFDGAAWSTLALTATSMQSGGMHIISSSWSDTAGDALDAADWAALLDLMTAEGASLDVRIAVGWDPAGSYSGVYTTGVATQAADSVVPVPLVMPGYSAEGFVVARSSTTQATYTWNAPMTGTYTDFRCGVWTS